MGNPFLAATAGGGHPTFMEKPVLVCLHGWGGTSASFGELREALSGAGIEILAPDLPGFGAEPEPPKPWTVDDYADWAAAYIRTHAHGPLFLLGHSHGGRIAIRLAVRGDPLVRHLFLCAAAGIRHPRHFKRIFGLTLAKAGKTLLSVPGFRSLQPLGKKLLYRLVRVHDYERASETMRKTLILVSREDLKPELTRIAAPTDIFWGKDDGMTPYGDAEIMHRAIRGSTLHAYEGTRHAVHRDRAKEVAACIRGRLGA